MGAGRHRCRQDMVVDAFLLAVHRARFFVSRAGFCGLCALYTQQKQVYARVIMGNYLCRGGHTPVSIDTTLILGINVKRKR